MKTVDKLNGYLNSVPNNYYDSICIYSYWANLYRGISYGYNRDLVRDVHGAKLITIDFHSLAHQVCVCIRSVNLLHSSSISTSSGGHLQQSGGA